MTSEEVKAEVNDWCNDGDGDIHLMGEAIKFYAEGIGYDPTTTIEVIDSFIGHLTAMKQKLTAVPKGDMEPTVAQMKDAFWSHVPESIEGYSGRINLLLDLLTLDQLQEACKIVGVEDDEY